MYKSIMYKALVSIFTLCLLAQESTATNTVARGNVEQHVLKSQALAENRIDLLTNRRISVYLPANYDKNKRYPVIYFLPFDKQLLEDKKVPALFDLAISKGQIREFIFVSGDFEIPGTINFYGNGSTTGFWIKYINEELVPFIDQRYSTIRSPAGRSIAGHFLGGYAAFRSAMLYPNMWGSLFALHPVATDTGEKSMLYVPDWKEIHSATSYADLKAPYSNPFVAMAQAHLPNPRNPPFYADFIVDVVDGELVPNLSAIRKLKSTFHLADQLPQYAENLQQLRGIKFVWGRNDANQAHVYGARKFSLLLENFGIEHEADEHRGNGWGYEFTTQGHIYRDMLPFFDTHFANE